MIGKTGKTSGMKFINRKKPPTFSANHIKNLKKANKGNTNGFKIGSKPWNRGKKGIVVHTIESRKKLSEAHKGKKNHLWKGGVTPINDAIRKSLEYKLWRESVFKRDNFQCIIGGKAHGNKLNADHIKPFSLFPELRFAIDNGRTLCIECHKKTDSYLNRWLKKSGEIEVVYDNFQKILVERTQGEVQLPPFPSLEILMGKEI